MNNKLSYQENSKINTRDKQTPIDPEQRQILDDTVSGAKRLFEKF